MKQPKMINRLIDIKQRAADAAENAHVVAHHTTRAAEERLQRAIAGWTSFVEEQSDVRTVADLEEQDRQYQWLRKVVTDAEKCAAVARNDEATKRELVTEARIELRRYETWLENTKELQRIEAVRTSRLADDEIAARKGRMGGH